MMSRQNNLGIVHSGFGHEDQIIDSYEMIKRLLVEFDGQASFKIILDNTLPLINGNPIYLKSLLRTFISDAIKNIQVQSGEFLLTHQKNQKSWIFSFSQLNVTSVAEDICENHYTSKFNLAIQKYRPNQYTAEVVLNS